MAEKITILTPEHVEVTYELAGIGSRFIAILIDTLLQLAFYVALIAVILAAMPVSAASRYLAFLPTWILTVGTLLFFTIYWGYFLYFEVRNNGQTPGKKVAGIRVILDTGHPLDFRGALLRNLIRAVDAFPGFYAIGVIAIFFSPQYRRLGDYAAGTLVVKTGSKQPEAPVVPVQAETPAFALPDSALGRLHTISGNEYRAIRHLLDRRRDLEPQVSDSFARRLVDTLAKKLDLDPQGIPDPFAFLEALSRKWEHRMIH